jgi:phage shock protein E
MNTRTVLILGGLLAGAALATAAEPEPVRLAAPATAVPKITQADLLARMDKPEAEVVVLDVRTPEEFAAGHVPGARNVAHDQLTAKLAELSSLKDKLVVLYCRSGRRSLLAAQTLRAAGFGKLLHLEGDWLAWEAEKRPIGR